MIKANIEFLESKMPGQDQLLNVIEGNKPGKPGKLLKPGLLGINKASIPAGDDVIIRERYAGN
jgi:hypothetical protein